MNLSLPNKMLRLEGAVILIAALFAYYQLGFGWLAFVLLLLWPDLAFIFYAVDKNLGILVYNLFHTLTFPIILIGISFIMSWPLGLQFALIWLAHIGMDRLVGYGLKYSGEGKDTHLNRI